MQERGFEAPLVIAGALGASDDHVVAGVDELLGVDAERGPVVGDLGEVGQDLIATFDLTSERELIRGDPDGVFGEQIPKGGQVAPTEGLIGGSGVVYILSPPLLSPPSPNLIARYFQHKISTSGSQ